MDGGCPGCPKRGQLRDAPLKPVRSLRSWLGIACMTKDAVVSG